VNTLGTLLTLNISGLSAQSSAYSLSCKATLGNQTFATNASLYYMPPNPYGGNTVKVDRTSGGALLVRNETAGEKAWTKIIPFGFYDVSARPASPPRGSSQDACNELTWDDLELQFDVRPFDLWSRVWH
jgi:hypothetical protein